MGVVHDARARVERLTEDSGNRRACGACLAFFASHWPSHVFFSPALVLCVTHCAALLHRPPGTRTDSSGFSSKRLALACICYIIARKDRASGLTTPLGHTTDTLAHSGTLPISRVALALSLADALSSMFPILARRTSAARLHHVCHSDVGGSPEVEEWYQVRVLVASLRHPQCFTTKLPKARFAYIATFKRMCCDALFMKPPVRIWASSDGQRRR